MGKSFKLKLKEQEIIAQKSQEFWEKVNKKIEVKKSISDFYYLLTDYSDYFINHPNNFTFKGKSKDIEKQFQQLISFTFKKYSIKNFFYTAWALKHGNSSILSLNSNLSFERNLFLSLIQGKSLHKTLLSPFLTKKEIHTFINSPFELSIQQNFIFSIAKQAGANNGNSIKIAKSKIVNFLQYFDTSKISDNLLQSKMNNFNFWKTVVKFFANDCPESVSQINDLIDFLMHKKNENNNFEIFGKGFTTKSLVKKMHDWHYELSRMKAIGEHFWPGSPIPDSYYEVPSEHDKNKKVIWSFDQIKDSKNLQKEGNTLRHCVLSYKNSCINGNISIWSLNLTNEYGLNSKKITIELSKNNNINQARGVANRLPTNAEKNIIKKWCFDNNLSWNYCY